MIGGSPTRAANRRRFRSIGVVMRVSFIDQSFVNCRTRPTARSRSRPSSASTVSRTSCTRTIARPACRGSDGRRDARGKALADVAARDVSKRCLARHSDQHRISSAAVRRDGAAARDCARASCRSQNRDRSRSALPAMPASTQAGAPASQECPDFGDDIVVGRAVCIVAGLALHVHQAHGSRALGCDARARRAHATPRRR